MKRPTKKASKRKAAPRVKQPVEEVREESTDKADPRDKFDTVYAYNQEINRQALEELKARGGRRPALANKLSVEKKLEFLSAMCDDGLTVFDAANRIGVSRVTLYKHRGLDPEFAAAWDKAYDDGTTVLEAEAQRRAVQGVTEAVYNKGVVVGHVQKYSDLLLIFLLKARAPQKFRDNIDVTNSDGSIAAAFAAAVRKAAS
jgi:hypothetical protein